MKLLAEVTEKEVAAEWMRKNFCYLIEYDAIERLLLIPEVSKLLVFEAAAVKYRLKEKESEPVECA